MKLKVFTLEFDPATSRFDDGELESFFETHEALTVHEHFFTWNDMPRWAVMVSYRDRKRSAGGKGQSRESRGKEDWLSKLSKVEKPVFQRIRKWRNEHAKNEGKPPYIILTNRQIVELVRNRPTTLTELGRVKGIGEKRIASYGEQLLEFVAIDEDGGVEEATNGRGGDDGE